MNILDENSSGIIKSLDLPKETEIRCRIIPIKIGAYGLAYYPERENQKRYRVDVDVRQSKSKFFKTLLHELVHVEQYYNAKLVMGEKEALWKGRLYKLEDHNNLKEYENQPWEIEANNKAKKLYKHLKL
jgi:hypothetical protein